jgi:hypothetical protein
MTMERVFHAFITFTFGTCGDAPMMMVTSIRKRRRHLGSSFAILFCGIVGVKAFLSTAKDENSAVAPTILAASSKRKPKSRRRKDEMDSLLTGKQDDLLVCIREMNIRC